MTEDQLKAIRLMAWWVTCIDASRSLDEEARIADDTPILHYVMHGATAIVTMADLRAIAAIRPAEESP